MHELELKDKQYIWHPFTPMKDWVEEEQLVIAAGKGIKLIDINGKEYYDGVSSLWVNVHGHRKEKINRAIRKQLDRIAHTTMLGLSNIPAIELAEQLVAIAPPGLNKVFYSDNGATAVEIAVKMAFQYWQLKGKNRKQKFVTLAGAYHGDTIGSVSVGGIDLFHRIFQPLLFKTIHAPCPSCYHCTLGAEPATCSMACATAMEHILEERHDEIAAVVMEPLVQGAAGILTQPPGYLKRVREMTRKYNVLLIADEVATGFGRTGKMFACEHEDVSPDFLTLAKGITGGYLPLAVTLTTDEIYDAFYGHHREKKTFFHGHSYTGNPLACAAALANLEVFREEGVLEGLPPKIAAVARKLTHFWELTHVGDVRQCGLMVGIEVVKDREKKIFYDWEDKIGMRICRHARQYGLIIRPLDNVVVFLPPLASSAADLETMLDIIYRS
ncbi:MAG: adenosylmethionine---8-amino-7-oxononanoate aminotransferase, partial [Moorella sp. (in: firmicutes)]|nr:adenosylmethionine---8-amino-7-oxononanoate aminotransferase [Moorella sp. (in: firmicutes)]